MTAMNRAVTDAIEALVDYNWADEEDDYWIECSDDPGDNQRSGHIFESILVIQRWLETDHGYPHREPRSGEHYAARGYRGRS